MPAAASAPEASRDATGGWRGAGVTAEVEVGHGRRLRGRRARAGPAPRRLDPTAAGFFDVDNTMMQGASIYYLARGLAARKYFTTGDLLRFGVQAAAVPAARRRARRRRVAGPGDRPSPSSLAARSTSCNALTEEIFDELMAERIWSGTHALARMHLDAGQRVWLVTAAPVEVGRGHRQAARPDRRDRHGRRDQRRRLHRTVGRRPDARPGQGRRDHRPRRPGGPGPEPAARRTATPSTTCRCSPRSAARSAVNPDSALRRAARERGWEIRDFRTGRKAAKVAVPTALGAGVVAGAVAAAIALNRRGAFRALRAIATARCDQAPTPTVRRLTTADTRRAYGGLSRTGRAGAPAACAGSAGWSRGPGRPG